MPTRDPRSADDLLNVGDTLHLGKADWVYGDRSMTVRVADIRYGHDAADSPVIGVIATVVDAGRDGRMVAIAVYRSALTRPGVRQRQHRPVNGVDPVVDPPPA
ncbi:hypothetical protein [Micromonospora sp. NBC_01813]|uniref:hypothetical protein n=1 Tax=Micromonospora sp. NBC_01813 TaxID=2975988 RepID=UPI002DD96F2B|nr:hypothetical protein [Micromonospora sp. NBC_01813]WSA11757.1 hypothetical protein OG958_13760 [Micromonospora sp. NBC_01813]